MKIKNGFSLREVCGEHVLVATGRENIDFSKVVSFNESAAYLWEKAIGHEFTAENLFEALMQEYEVEAETAKADVQAVLKQWGELGLVEGVA